MKEFTNETFRRLFSRSDRLRFERMQFLNCTFENCGLSLTEDISRMSSAHGIELANCRINHCHFGPLIASEVAIHNLETNDLLILWCPYFDRVALSGELGRLKINATAAPSTLGNEKQRPFDEFRKKFYAEVEWALDISEARFKECDLEGIPAHLIRRDPESQIIVTRERALQVATPGWEAKLGCPKTHLPFVINLFLTDGYPEIVLVAPLGGTKAERDAELQTLREFRRIGLAQPD